MSKIQAKRVLFMDPRPKKSSNITGYDEYHRSRSSVFQKYFPKYMINFDLQIDNAFIKSKLKRMKVIKAFQDQPRSPPLKALVYRLLLGNKARFIKKLCSNRDPLARLIQNIKLCTNLRSIQLHLGLSLLFSLQRFGQTIRALRKIRRLKNVKSLVLNQLGNSSFVLINAMNASARFLSSLKSLVLSPGPAIDGNDGVLRMLKDSKNLLKYMTSVHLPNLRSPSHLESFRNLQDSCPNLTNLSFEFSYRTMYFITKGSDRYSDECFPVEVNYLSAIETFQSLRSLRLNIADAFTFLNDFTCPPSIEGLRLDIKECLTKEILTQVDHTFIKKQVLEFFETSPALLKFYNKFKSLQNLQVLEIFFTRDVDPEDYQHHNYLSRGILKRISSLQKFTFAENVSYCELNHHNRSPVQDFYLPELIKSCHSSRQTLQTLEIDFGAKVIFSSFDLFSSQNKFPNLSTITLNGKIDNNGQSNTEIGLFLKQVIALGTSITTIKFNTFVHGTVKSLLSLLQQLNQLQKPENLCLKLQIKFSGTPNLEDLGAGFEEIIKPLQENQVEYAKLQGVSLNIYMSEAKNAKEFLEVYGQKFDSFKTGYSCYF